ncbi:alpha-soluble NSF attachment protein-like [Gigantopelta aegis]|uniref:alpha-soluble NSF attachment protein-like n=1 Tax=Gigantopelta aegis TaxID=1735272 RepID=UPI001B8888BE|nr:alpha-soluble NSF attachment protein-like [Gigantopelta aegis]
MADQEEKGKELVAEADKKLNSSKGFFGSLFGGSTKVEEAAELYVRAANAFKMAKKWAAAGDAFCRAAQLQLKATSRHEAATHFVDAGTCYRKADPMEAINSFRKAVEIYTDMGRFTIAAKHHEKIAEIYETELVDIEKAITNYEQAADYFKGEESNSSANKCLLKVAQFSAQLENYEKAIDIYEQIAVAAMDNSLLKYSAKDHFFRAAVCHMCGADPLNTRLVLQKYEEMFPAFSDSRECKLLKALLQACEDENVEAYTDALKNYDSISRLDPWLTSMFLKVKNTLSSETELC